MKGTDVLLAKGPSHTRMKETLAKTITSASSDVEKIPKEDDDGQIDNLPIVFQ